MPAALELGPRVGFHIRSTPHAEAHRGGSSTIATMPLLGRYPARVVVVALALLVTACGWFSCESPIERERRALREATESSEAVLYRGLKIALRSAPLDGDAASDPSATQIRRLTASIFTRVLHDPGTEAAPATPIDHVALAKEFYALRDELRSAHEDDYPTLLQQLLVAGGDRRSATALLPWYSPSWEHLILAVSWTGSGAPPSFALHELAALDPATLDDAGVRVGARVLRGAAFYQYHWPHLAEQELGAALDDIDASKAELVGFTRTMGGAPAGAGDEAIVAQWHGPTVLLRGLVRRDTGDDDGSLDDLDAGLADAHTLGVEDDAVWLVEAYVGLRRGDPDRALVNLRKLQASPSLDANTRALVDDAVAALESRDPDSALDVVTDKVLVAKVVGSHAARMLGTIDWRAQLEANAAGRALLGLHDVVDDEVGKVAGALSAEQLESLGQQAAESTRRAGAKARDGAVEAWHRVVDR